ncbi:MAG: IclR family transcriptional regulator [Deferribacteraceae bacterium]|nr:IclR family transcriptional regulator [Deferribacteraceae bacterium]
MRENSKRLRSDYSVQQVINAIELLETLGDTEHEASVEELSNKLTLTRNTVLKLLASLETYGYVACNRYTGNYRLGVRTFQIAQSYTNKLSLTEMAQSVQKELRDAVNESVYISVLRKERVVYLSVVESDSPVRVLPRIGNTGLAYATATGKAQIAFMEEHELELLYSEPFEQYTKNTVANIKQLVQELAKIRKLGYAVDNEEYEQGVCCVAVPVKNFMGAVIAGLSISAPKDRMSDARIKKELLPQLIASAAKLSTKFGFKVSF